MMSSWPRSRAFQADPVAGASDPNHSRRLVPVSVRAPGEENVYGNQVSAVLADLPVHVCDPVERLAAVQAELQARLKASKEATVGEALASLQLSRLPARILVERWRSVPPAGDCHRYHECARSPATTVQEMPTAGSWKSSPTCRSPPRSVPGSRSYVCGNVTFGITATSQTPTSTCSPAASSTAYPRAPDRRQAPPPPRTPQNDSRYIRNGLAGAAFHRNGTGPAAFPETGSRSSGQGPRRFSSSPISPSKPTRFTFPANAPVDPSEAPF